MSKYFSAILVLLSVLAYPAFAENKIMYAAAVEGLNLRADKSVTVKVLARIPFCQKLEIVGTEEKALRIGGVFGNWVKTTWQGLSGWVFDAYLCSYPITVNRSYSQKREYIGIEEGALVYLVPEMKEKMMEYGEPDTNTVARALFLEPVPTALSVTVNPPGGTSQEWIRIEFRGKTGWIMRNGADIAPEIPTPLLRAYRLGSRNARRDEWDDSLALAVYDGGRYVLAYDFCEGQGSVELECISETADAIRFRSKKRGEDIELLFKKIGKKELRLEEGSYACSPLEGARFMLFYTR
jgi:hypothetical protein